MLCNRYSGPKENAIFEAWLQFAVIPRRRHAQIWPAMYAPTLSEADFGSMVVFPRTQTLCLLHIRLSGSRLVNPPHLRGTVCLPSHQRVGLTHTVLAVDTPNPRPRSTKQQPPRQAAKDKTVDGHCPALFCLRYLRYQQQLTAVRGNTQYPCRENNIINHFFRSLNDNSGNTRLPSSLMRWRKKNVCPCRWRRMSAKRA